VQTTSKNHALDLCFRETDRRQIFAKDLIRGTGAADISQRSANVIAVRHNVTDAVADVERRSISLLPFVSETLYFVLTIF